MMRMECMIRANTEGERSVVLVYSCRLDCRLLLLELVKVETPTCPKQEKGQVRK